MSSAAGEEEFTARFLAALGELAPEGAPLLARHAWLVARKNEVMNLTRITEPEDMAIRHALDSLAAAPVLGNPEAPVSRVLDLGTGAGWPGLALAIALPHLHVTCLDATRKKVAFLDEVVADLGLEDRVDCVWARFEDWIRPHRKDYEMVLARAAGPIVRILEWCTNRWFGPLVLWKGPGLAQELEEARSVMKKRRLHVAFDQPYELPGDDVERHLVILDWE